jgi:hypothetical protein
LLSTVPTGSSWRQYAEVMWPAVETAERGTGCAADREQTQVAADICRSMVVEASGVDHLWQI